MRMDTLIQQFADTIRAAAENRRPLRICGGGSKSFYGNPATGEDFGVTGYRGIVDYEPTELVITARAGTPLAEIESTMREQGQMLGFEPPHFDGGATLGGCIAAGLSGPRRAAAGAARDFVLGLRLLDGRGTDLRFGGQVMKNVAGYDMSRLVTGSLGTLGLILEVSLKALPLPPAELTLACEMPRGEAIEMMNALAGQPLPVTATCHVEKRLYLRLAGAETAVKAAAKKIGGETMPNAAEFWRNVRDHRDLFFSGDGPVWRLSLTSTAPEIDLPGHQLVEWGGALRWLKTDAGAESVRKAAHKAGGHATLFRRGRHDTGAFHPLPEALMQLHRRVKQAMDPAGIFNRGRLYPEW
ncbi:MAG: glycolate oxidase subunit GlcE [Burkholderiales bacterium]|nr:glycolate oxidase subunit GlcE [Burkholderiales bacterium]